MQVLDNKIAVVTGSSKGIGKCIAEALASKGACVVLASRDHSSLERVVQGIHQSGGRAIAYPTDVTSESSVINLFEKVFNEFHQIDLLVNNAGVNVGIPTHELSLEDWQRVIDVNLTGAFLCSREALKLMKLKKSGRIINIGSVSAKVPRPNSAPYVCSKFALDGLTRSMALDARADGINVSIIHPGNTLTPIWQGKEDLAASEGVMKPEDLAQVVATTAALPPEMNILESIVMPNSMPFVGRG
jgi:NAD(P)-dependent dehydrogenase (short-subunit alcohol dehydrogenase family)